MKLTKLFTS